MDSVSGLFSTVPTVDHLGFWTKRDLRGEKVVAFLQLDKVDVARIANVSVNSVRFDRKMPTSVLRSLEQTALACTLVAEFFDGDAQTTARWFWANNPLFGDASPRDMIRHRRVDKLMQVILHAIKEKQ